MSDLLRGVAQDSRDAARVAINVDKGGALDTIVALPFDREAGIGLLQYGSVRDLRPWPDGPQRPMWPGREAVFEVLEATFSPLKTA